MTKKGSVNMTQDELYMEYQQKIQMIEYEREEYEKKLWKLDDLEKDNVYLSKSIDAFLSDLGDRWKEDYLAQKIHRLQKEFYDTRKRILTNLDREREFIQNGLRKIDQMEEEYMWNYQKQREKLEYQNKKCH